MNQQDFDVETLATYLHLTPNQVERLASRGKLPGRKIAGRWRFARAEIHHWFEQRIGLSDEDELLEVEEMLRSGKPEMLGEPADLGGPVLISDLLPRSAIAVPLEARTKNSVIERICQQAADAGLLWDTAKMADAIRNREELHPTALESGVALLHPRRPIPGIIAETFLALGVTHSGIPFGGPRGSLTDIFFLIASASDAVHLKVLARLSRMLSNPQLLADLRASTTGDEAWQAIRAEDQQLTN